jgi:hypothetical protein
MILTIQATFYFTSREIARMTELAPTYIADLLLSNGDLDLFSLRLGPVRSKSQGSQKNYEQVTHKTPPSSEQNCNP